VNEEGNALVLALGVGVWMSAGRQLASRLTAALLILYAVISYLGGTVFQMDPRETEGSVRTMLHERATAVMVFSMLMAMAFGAFARGMRFRLYSLGTPAHGDRVRRADVYAGRKACRQRAVRGWCGVPTT
jgi:hypothetical protein